MSKMNVVLTDYQIGTILNFMQVATSGAMTTPKADDAIDAYVDIRTSLRAAVPIVEEEPVADAAAEVAKDEGDGGERSDAG